MRRRRPVLWLAASVVLVSLVGSVQLAPAARGGGLTVPEWRTLEQRDLVVKTRAVEGYRWPEVTVYRLVSAPPEEVMAVYADFKNQADYLPNLVESHVVEQLSRNSFHVSYEYEVTGPNERYTVLVAVSRTPSGFQVTWDLVKARYARRLSGQMRVAPSDLGTLIEYTNHVDPGFLGSRFGSPETTVRLLRETVRALATHVEWIRVEHPEELTVLVEALHSMVGER